MHTRINLYVRARLCLSVWLKLFSKFVEFNKRPGLLKSNLNRLKTQSERNNKNNLTRHKVDELDSVKAVVTSVILSKEFTANG